MHVWLFVSFLFTVPVGALAAAALVPATLPELLQYAVKNNVSVPQQQAQLSSLAGGTQSSEALLFNNPVIDWNSGQRRSVAGNPDNVQESEWGAGISQAFEIAGQQGYRQETAQFAMSAFREESLDTQNQVLLTTSTLFYQILALQEKVRLEREAVELYSKAELLVSRQRQSGSATRLDNNLATIEQQLANNQLLTAQQDLKDIRSQLARFLLTSEDTIPEMKGDFDTITHSLPYTYPSLVLRLRKSPKLTALEWQEKAAMAELELQMSAPVI